jgi:putative ABC transport system permease protein
MFRIALRMLTGDTTKFLALVVGLAFSTMLVTQQGSVFTGLMRRSAMNIVAIPEADVWVMHPNTKFFDERKAIQNTALQIVRGVEGVDWAERLFVGQGAVQMPDGGFAGVLIIGAERGAGIGLATRFEGGNPDLISQPDAIYWDNVNLPQFKHIKPFDVLEINDRRARVVAIAAAPRPFLSSPIVFTTYERAIEFSPSERKQLTYVLVHAKAGVDPKTLARTITEKTGLGAKTSDEFFWSTIFYYLRSTGIGINFGTTVFLGILVGIAIAGQTFFTFIVENTRYFGALKAMGLSNFRLVLMVLIQALTVGLMGWGIGVGLAALFGWNINDRTTISFMMTPQLLGASLALSLSTVLFAGLISVRRVLKIEPAIVFR